MAREVRKFQVTTPAGTTEANPLVTDLAMPPRIVDQINVLVPPGNSGALRFAIGMAGQAIIPNNAGEWMIANGQYVQWPLSNQPDSGAWQMISWNDGNFDHTVFVTFELSLTSDTAAPVSAPVIASAVLSNVAPGG